MQHVLSEGVSIDIMKIRFYKTLFCLLLIVVLCSCNKTAPAGFWSSFHDDLLKENISDQGPHGGHRALLWVASGNQHFHSTDIINFAKGEGWEFVDSLHISTVEMTDWVSGGKLFFPFSFKEFSGRNETTSNYFPRWISANATVYEFKTGWDKYEAGSDKSTNVNGFALLSDDAKMLSVYHLWGE